MGEEEEEEDMSVPYVSTVSDPSHIARVRDNTRVSHTFCAMDVVSDFPCVHGGSAKERGHR